MAFSSTERGYDLAGRGVVYGNFTLTAATVAGAFSVPFAQVRHASFSNNVFSVPVTYAAVSYHVDLTAKALSCGTYLIYGE